MRFLRVLAVLALLFLLSCSRAADDNDDDVPSIFGRLQQVEGLQVSEIAPPTGFREAFQVDITQPVDHGDAARGNFLQRFYLSYRRPEAPTVFYTTGYGVRLNYESEPAALLQANQVLMVHRYFPDAVPSGDWSFLTTAQAAADQHRVREKLGGILQGKWVASGASKGGMTALYYRYYHPADVDATVAYVAPIMQRTEDPRFIAFLEQVGDADCRERIRLFQREVLERRAAMLALVHAHAASRNYSFTVFSEAQAFEYSVLEYPFAFWQYGSAANCGSIPGAGATDQQLFDHLVDVSPLSYYADADYSYYRPLFYQAYTEIGYCPYVHDHLAGLLLAVPEPSYRAFAPRGVEMTFRPGVMGAVVPWLRDHGERIVYIYGGIDPWTAAALQPAAGLDALQVVQPGANHGVKIVDLDQKSLVVDALERWLQVDISLANLPAAAEVRERERL